ncbi:Aminotransferase class I and II [Mycena kentingensis (nom. inval.)]|nr:Aminotransferase class I and II [Mycena kentingensis (nom. inval.)]
MLLGFQVSRGVVRTITPPIPTAYAWADRYNFAHGPLLDMSQGVPGNPPQESIRSAVGSAASSLGSFGYCPSEGERSLREGIAREMRAVYGEDADVQPEDMSLTSGCNMAFMAAIMTLADAGDEVILPVPWYFNHQMTLSMLGITTVPLKTLPENEFIPAVEDARALMTPKTRAIALVTPNNPTGATYPPSLITAFSELAVSLGIALILDETYRDFISPPSPPHTLFSSPAWRTHLIHLFSFSKSYAVPGHRLGLLVAAPAFQKPLCKVLDTMQICAPRPIQLALAPLIDSGVLRPGIQQIASAIKTRHALFRSLVPAGWSVASSGGYFAFVRHPFAGRRSTEVCQRLAIEMGVILLPGVFFRDEAQLSVDEDRWIRFSVANCDEEKIHGVCERLKMAKSVFGWDCEGALE